MSTSATRKEYLECTYLEILQEVMRRDAMYPHVEGHKVRQAWIKRVIECYEKHDDCFCELVTMQLSLYCDFPDLTVLKDVCDSPKHRIRNRLLVWHIDHPGDKP